MFGGVGGQETFRFAELVESAQGGDLEIERFVAETFGISGRGGGGGLAEGVSAFGGERTAALVLEKGGEMAEIDLLPALEVPGTGPGDKCSELVGVGPDRVVGLPAFVADMREEILDQRVHGPTSPEAEARRKVERRGSQGRRIYTPRSRRRGSTRIRDGTRMASPIRVPPCRGSRREAERGLQLARRQ